MKFIITKRTPFANSGFGSNGQFCTGPFGDDYDERRDSVIIESKVLDSIGNILWKTPFNVESDIFYEASYNGTHILMSKVIDGTHFYTISTETIGLFWPGKEGIPKHGIDYRRRKVTKPDSGTPVPS